MFFFLSKIFWIIFNPFNFIVLLIFIASIFYFFKNKILYKFFYLIALFCFIFSCVLPTGNYLLNILEKDFHRINIPEKIDGILILSGAVNANLTKEHQRIQLGSASERLFASIKLIKKYPNAKIIFSGGSPYLFDNLLKQADIVKTFFDQFEIDTTKIIFEKNARNTYENIYNSKILAKPKKNENWLIITSAFHMHRTLKVGNKLGWKLIPYAVDFYATKKTLWIPSIFLLKNISLLNLALHEWIGLLTYYLTEKSSDIL